MLLSFPNRVGGRFGVVGLVVGRNWFRCGRWNALAGSVGVRVKFWGWVLEESVDLSGDISMLLCFTNRGFGWWPLWVRAGW